MEKMPTYITVYGKVVRTWEQISWKTGKEETYQYEIEYTTYDAESGEIVETGTKDMSPERLREILVYDVQAGAGRIRRDGAEMTAKIGTVRVRKTDRVAIKAARLVYGDTVRRVEYPLPLTSYRYR